MRACMVFVLMKEKHGAMEARHRSVRVERKPFCLEEEMGAISFFGEKFSCRRRKKGMNG